MRSFILCVVFLSSIGYLPASDSRYPMSGPTLEFLAPGPVNEIRIPLFQPQPEIDVGITRDVFLNNEFATFNAGGQFHIIGASILEFLGIELGGLGLIRSEFDLFSPSFYHLGNDFHMGLILGLQLDQYRFESSFFHVSSHYGDNFSAENNHEVLNIGYETLRNQFLLPLGESLIVLGGVDWKLGRRPLDWIRDPLTAQLVLRWLSFGKNSPLSLESGFDYDVMQNSVDLAARLEFLFSDPSQGWQEGGGHRFYVNIFKGKSSQGVYYLRDEFRISAGMVLLK